MIIRVLYGDRDVKLRTDSDNEAAVRALMNGEYPGVVRFSATGSVSDVFINFSPHVPFIVEVIDRPNGK